MDWHKCTIIALITILNIDVILATINYGCNGRMGENDIECNAACKGNGYQIGHCDIYMRRCTCFGYYLPYNSLTHSDMRDSDEVEDSAVDQLINEAQEEVVVKPYEEEVRELLDTGLD
ncbi:unnamed protein product [Medioppia subpectinata]|uniref:Defensin n=1 Tax=Medioppia subpectinata TaxID=1979941 RepID=A0A7R9LT16_9ACAR|nr:unnamed protein product [Medioppia subpectinata]CAG2121156.1 unnamed protein product [Medioppia subpectinata]